MQSQQLLIFTLFTMSLFGLMASKSPLEGQEDTEKNRTSRDYLFTYEVVKHVMVESIQDDDNRKRNSRILDVIGHQQDFGQCLMKPTISECEKYCIQIFQGKLIVICLSMCCSSVFWFSVSIFGLMLNVYIFSLFLFFFFFFLFSLIYIFSLFVLYCVKCKNRTNKKKIFQGELAARCTNQCNMNWNVIINFVYIFS